MKNYRVVGLERRGKLLLAAVVKTKAEKQEVYLESGDKVSIALEKNIWSFAEPIEANDDKTLKIVLANFRNSHNDDIDLTMLWECLEQSENYRFRDLLENYFGECTEEGARKLFISLCRDNRYFQYKNNFFTKISPEIVEKNQLRELREKQKRATEQTIIEWLKTGKGNVDKNCEYSVKLLDNLKKFALCGEKQGSNEGKRIAQQLSMDADDLLIALEQRQILEKNFNEVPYRYQLQVKFPTKVQNEAQKIIECETLHEGKRLLQDIWSIAIDDADTEEVDDALSFHQENDLRVVGIHIANAAHTIKPETALDQFARDRFATLYFPEGKIPLFPKPLVQEKLTLATSLPRAALSGFFFFDQENELIDFQFEETTLMLSERCTYQETVGEKCQRKEFDELRVIAQSLREKRQEAGAVITHTPDLKIEILDEETVVLKKNPPGLPGSLVVSEFMIFFNQMVAKTLWENNVPAFYRIQQEKPNPVEIAIDDPLYPVKCRWGLKGASLSTTCAPHRTLGIDHYSQNSSPIRRYGDLIIQRQLLAWINQEEYPYDQAKLQEMKIEIERNEKAAKIAGYDRRAFWIYKYLKQNKGKIYQGFVSRVLDNSRVMVFIPEILQEFPFKVEFSTDAREGVEINLRLQSASPRKKKAHWAKVN